MGFALSSLPLPLPFSVLKVPITTCERRDYHLWTARLPRVNDAIVNSAITTCKWRDCERRDYYHVLATRLISRVNDAIIGTCDRRDYYVWTTRLLRVNDAIITTCGTTRLLARVNDAIITTCGTARLLARVNDARLLVRVNDAIITTCERRAIIGTCERRDYWHVWTTPLFPRENNGKDAVMCTCERYDYFHV